MIWLIPATPANSNKIVVGSNSYSSAHGSSSGTLLDKILADCSNSYDPVYSPSSPYIIRRMLLTYDISVLAGLSVSEAWVTFPSGDIVETDSGDADIHIVEGLHHTPPIATDFGATTAADVSGGHINYSDISDNTLYIPLNSQGLIWLLSTGKLCTRLSGDIDNHVPTGKNAIRSSSGATNIDSNGFSWLLYLTLFNVVDDYGDSLTLKVDIQGAGFPPILIVKHDGAQQEYPKFRIEYWKTGYYYLAQHTDEFTFEDEYPLSKDFPVTGLTPNSEYRFIVQCKYCENDDWFILYPTKVYTTGSIAHKLYSKRIGSIRHLYRPGAYTQEITFGGLVRGIDYPDIYNLTGKLSQKPIPDIPKSPISIDDHWTEYMGTSIPDKTKTEIDKAIESDMEDKVSLWDYIVDFHKKLFGSDRKDR